MHELFNLATVLLGIYAKETKTYIPTEICMGLFIAVPFLVAKKWKQSKRPSVGEWITSGTATGCNTTHEQKVSNL